MEPKALISRKGGENFTKRNWSEEKKFELNWILDALNAVKKRFAAPAVKGMKFYRNFNWLKAIFFRDDDDDDDDSQGSEREK